MGIAEQIKDGLVVLDGLTEKEAHERFWLVDREGLLVESMGNSLREGQKPYARDDSQIEGWEFENPEQRVARLIDVVRHVKPTVLIGTSTQSRAFDEQIIREMAKHVERPIIFPMSNPTALCEVDPRGCGDSALTGRGRAHLDRRQGVRRDRLALHARHSPGWDRV